MGQSTSDCVRCQENIDKTIVDEKAFLDKEGLHINNDTPPEVHSCYCGWIFKKDLTIVEVKQNIRFERCRFEGKVSLPKEYRHIEFVDCTFEIIDSYIRVVGGEIKRLELLNKRFAEKYYLNEKIKIQRITKCTDKTIDKTMIEIDYSTCRKVELFDQEYYLKHTLTICKLHIGDSTIFEEKVKLNKCEINDAIFCDIDFKKNVDFNGSTFDAMNDSIAFEGITFEGMAFFNDTIFHKFVNFYKVTFSDNATFKCSEFAAGLNLDYATIKKGVNFAGVVGLESSISQQNSSRETYRIIKYHFEKLKNKIEANKFHSLEQKKYLSEVFNDIRNDHATVESLADGITSLMSWLSSNYGLYWFVPLFWIIVVAIGSSLYFGDATMNAMLNSDANMTAIVKNGLITSKLDNHLEAHPIAFVLNKAALSFLYYQFIISLRKMTRR